MSSTPPPLLGVRPALLYTILIIMSTTGPLAMNIFVPSIPGLMHEFSATSGMVQWTLTVYLAGMALSQLFYGPLSDRYGRRPAVLIGLVLYIIASLLCAYAPSIETLMAARFVQALGGAAGMVLSRAIIRDLHDRETSASVLGYITMVWVLVPMFAPALGGLVEQYTTWRLSFILLSLFGALVFALTLWGLPESNARADHDSANSTGYLTSIIALIRQPRFIAYTLTLGFTSALFFSFIAGAPFIMIEVLSRPPLDYGLWFMLVSVGYMAGNFFSGRYSQRVGIDRMIVSGNILAIIGAVLMLIAAQSGALSPLTLFTPMLFVTLGNGMTIPNGTAAAISVLPTSIGAAAGLSGFSQMAIGATASQVTGILQGEMPFITFWIMTAGAILAFLTHQVMTIHYPSSAQPPADEIR